MEKIVIAIDTMGTDNGSAYFVQGIAEAMDLYDDLSFIVTGKEEELKTYIDQYGCDKTRIEVVDATEEITCHDAPVDAIRRKKNSSMVLALNAVKEVRAEVYCEKKFFKKSINSFIISNNAYGNCM